MSRNSQSNGFIGGDERLKKSDGGDVRADRDSADLSRTLSNGTAFNADEFRTLLRDEFKQEVLPTPPAISGYHLCWLSTNSKADPIHNRMRLGYTPVKASEVTGMENYSMKGGEWDGFVSCNEMVLFKIPRERYQLIMAEYHHHMPLEEEKGIREKIDAAKKDGDGRDAVDFDKDDEGMRAIGKNRAVPVFD